MPTKAISIITITFNNFSELKRTIDSLPDSELIENIVVNGGKCPETFKFLKSYKGVSVSENDRGISDAFNKGLLMSSGDYITFLNSGDVLLDKDYYNKAISVLNTDLSIDFVYADICLADQFAGDIHIKSTRSLPYMPFLHPTLIVRRSIFERIGLFNLSYKIAMDLDFAYRLVKSNAQGRYIPEMVIHMDGGGISSTNYKKTFIETLKVIINNKDFSAKSFLYLVKTSLFLLLKIAILQINGDKMIAWYKRKLYRKEP